VFHEPNNVHHIVVVVVNVVFGTTMMVV